VSTPLFHFNDDKSRLIDEVVRHTTDQVKDPLLALNEAAYLEMRRLEKRGGPALQTWRSLAGSLGHMSLPELRAKVNDLARDYAWDIAGNFDPRVYKAVTKLAAPLLGGFLSPRATLRNIRQGLDRNLTDIFDLSALDGRMVVQGPRETIRKLGALGTVVFVPTHLSNLDSVVFGFALERAGLFPATYGAGKNLFTNPVLSYFMHNLGAYRVDRRLRHSLYKDVLKAYSGVLIEHGFHSLFFPGGTRSRSGGVERRLKLGLAGTGLEAFSRTAERGRVQKVFFVPATINYLLTLEAETLIDDFLSEEGKARYIIEDDESTRVGRVASFMQKLLGLDGSCVIRLSQPLDCFGNAVDEEGRSYDARGRVVDPLTYVMGAMDGEDRPRRDFARDAQYTRELGEAICAEYKNDTVAMATHLVAAAAFATLARSLRRGPAGEGPPRKEDLFVLLRQDDVLVPRAQLVADVDLLVERAREMAGRGQLVLGPSVAHASAESIVSEALRAFAGYHTREVIAPRGNDLVLADPRLLFYYQNRLAAHGLAIDFLQPAPSGLSTRTRLGYTSHPAP
jgi:glycerol-3-phosphate O-acyltransferase